MKNHNRILVIDDEDINIDIIELLFHDVGKIGIRDAILLKPAKFTPQEF